MTYITIPQETMYYGSFENDFINDEYNGYDEYDGYDECDGYDSEFGEGFSYNENDENDGNDSDTGRYLNIKSTKVCLNDIDLDDDSIDYSYLLNGIKKSYKKCKVFRPVNLAPESKDCTTMNELYEINKSRIIDEFDKQIEKENSENIKNRLEDLELVKDLPTMSKARKKKMLIEQQERDRIFSEKIKTMKVKKFKEISKNNSSLPFSAYKGKRRCVKSSGDSTDVVKIRRANKRKINKIKKKEEETNRKNFFNENGFEKSSNVILQSSIIGNIEDKVVDEDLEYDSSTDDIDKDDIEMRNNLELIVSKEKNLEKKDKDRKIISENIKLEKKKAYEEFIKEKESWISVGRKKEKKEKKDKYREVISKNIKFKLDRKEAGKELIENWISNGKEKEKKINDKCSEVKESSFESSNRFRTKMCRSVINNTKCPHGLQCRYAHSDEQLVPSLCLFGSSCRFVELKNGFWENNGNKKCFRLHTNETKDNLIRRKKNITVSCFKKPIIINPTIFNSTKNVENNNKCIDKDKDIPEKFNWTKKVDKCEDKCEDKCLRENMPEKFNWVKKDNENNEKEFVIVCSRLEVLKKCEEAILLGKTNIKITINSENKDENKDENIINTSTLKNKMIVLNHNKRKVSNIDNSNKLNKKKTDKYYKDKVYIADKNPYSILNN